MRIKSERWQAKVENRAFSLMCGPASMQIYCSERKRLHKRFIVLDHQYGRGDVIWRWSIWKGGGRERRKDMIKGARFSAAYPLKVNKRGGHFPDENIKPIQFLQQYHVRGRDIRYALPYSVHIKQWW